MDKLEYKCMIGSDKALVVSILSSILYTASWVAFSWKVKVCLSCTVLIMAVEDLATLEIDTSTAMQSAYVALNSTTSAPGGLSLHWNTVMFIITVWLHVIEMRVFRYRDKLFIVFSVTWPSTGMMLENRVFMPSANYLWLSMFMTMYLLVRVHYSK